MGKKLRHVYVPVGVYMLFYTVEEGRGGAGITGRLPFDSE